MLSLPSRLVLNGHVVQRSAVPETTLNEGEGGREKTFFFFARLRDLRAVRPRAAVRLRKGIHRVALRPRLLPSVAIHYDNQHHAATPQTGRGLFFRPNRYRNAAVTGWLTMTVLVRWVARWCQME